ncbi:hypothetical protein FRC07_002381 [Ceratobasidium sp. 392]|nr:hypothetical protein FRC07_002381 [Ceratobasidium sp. 392]
MVGQGSRPSALRPNLANSASTTSDDNWARILEDVDPPSPQLMHSARALRSASLSPPIKKYGATELELRAMENIFERVFDMGVSTNAQSYPLSARRNIFLSNFSPGGHMEPNPELQFDAKREEMFRCQSDQELLRWAAQEVFLRAPGETTSSTSSSDAPTKNDSKISREMHPEIYGRIVASLMTEFREQYNNPHLAIAIFDYTRRLSIISYVTGCTAPSYNELMRTHWLSFRNLQAVANVAEEMRVNGVLPDQATASLLNQIHDEAGPQVVWAKENDEAEIAKLLEQLDELLRPPEYKPIATSQKRRQDGGHRLIDGLPRGARSPRSKNPDPAAP